MTWRPRYWRYSNFALKACFCVGLLRACKQKKVKYMKMEYKQEEVFVWLFRRGPSPDGNHIPATHTVQSKNLSILKALFLFLLCQGMLRNDFYFFGFYWYIFATNHFYLSKSFACLLNKAWWLMRAKSCCTIFYSSYRVIDTFFSSV